MGSLNMELYPSECVPLYLSRWRMKEEVMKLEVFSEGAERGACARGCNVLAEDTSIIMTRNPTDVNVATDYTKRSVLPETYACKRVV